MKIRILIIVSLLFIVVSCNNNQKKSDAYGNFEAIEITISSLVNGKIEELNLSEGQTLAKDEIKGFIDTLDLFLKKEQLVAQKEAIKSKNSNITTQLDILKQQKKNLEIEKKRILKMFNEGAASQKQLDDISGNVDVIDKQILSVQTQYQSVFSEVESFQKQIEQIEFNINKCYIKSNINGIVLVKYAEQGEFAQIGRPLFKIADLSTMNIKVYISGDQLPKIKIGDRCKVYIDKNISENREYIGFINWISDNAEFTPKIIQTKKERVSLVYAVKISVKNDGLIKIGMPGEVLFN